MPDTDCIFLTVNGKRQSLRWLIKNAAAATDVRVYNCPGLTALPELPAASEVWVENCPGLFIFTAGKDSRGYQFPVIRLRSQWRIVAGCRNFTVKDARRHWGPGGPSNRADCAALVEKLAADIVTVDCGEAA